MMQMLVPEAFSLVLVGPEGPYALAFRPTATWEGEIDTCIAGCVMRWPVEHADHGGEGLCLSGMTVGSEVLWRDQFWFELRPEARPPRIDYWGDRFVWRSDAAVPEAADR
jgi:hypothetical protein